MFLLLLMICLLLASIMFIIKQKQKVPLNIWSRSRRSKSLIREYVKDEPEYEGLAYECSKADFICAAIAVGIFSIAFIYPLYKAIQPGVTTVHVGGIRPSHSLEVDATIYLIFGTLLISFLWSIIVGEAYKYANRKYLPPILVCSEKGLVVCVYSKYEHFLEFIDKQKINKVKFSDSYLNIEYNKPGKGGLSLALYYSDFDCSKEYLEMCLNQYLKM